MKNMKIAISTDRTHIRLSWESGKYWKEVRIPIAEYYETKIK